MNSYYHRYIKLQLEDDVFDEIIQITNQHTDFKPSGSHRYDGKDYIPDETEQRKSKSVSFMDPALENIVEAVIRSVNIELNWNFHLVGLEEAQHICYGEGDHFNWHVDEVNWMPGKNKFNLMKKLSYSILLNDEFTGGEFDVYTTRAETIQLQKKDILIFHSDILHQVRPILSGTRYALAGWVLGPPWR